MVEVIFFTVSWLMLLGGIVVVCGDFTVVCGVMSVVVVSVGGASL